MAVNTLDKRIICNNAETLDLKKRASRIAFLQVLRSEFVYGDKKQQNLFEAFLFSCGSSKVLRENLSGYKYINWRKRYEKEREKQSQWEFKMLHNRYRNMLYELRKAGLISSQNNITTKGIAYLKECFLRLKKEKHIPLVKQYEKIQTKTVTLITYDIPERHKNLRMWIRFTLRSLDFEMLHKSVWIGNYILPKEFIYDLKNMGLLKYVQIVQITKPGSLHLVC